MMVGDDELPVGWNDIDMTRFKAHAASDLSHLHSSPSREDVGKFALVRRIEMYDNNEGRVDIIRQTFEKHLQGVNTASRRSDADGRKSLGCSATSHFLAYIVHWMSRPVLDEGRCDARFAPSRITAPRPALR
jgi:hypothetical protein